MSSTTRWWACTDEADLTRELVHTAQALQRLQSVRLQNAFHHHRLYAGLSPQSLVGFAVMGYIDPAPVDELLVPRHPVNIVKSTVDTVVAQVGEQDVKASFLTDGGSYDQQRKAKQMERFTDGCFFISGWHHKALQVLTDACIFGTGAARIGVYKGKPFADRVQPFELLVDDLDGREGKPQQLIHRRLVSRDILLAMYPDAAEVIEGAQGTRLRVLSSTMSADMLEVFEAWHLPSGPDADDGRRAIVLENGPLAIEDWERDDFPFVVLRGTSGGAQIGWWGTGLGELLGPLQWIVNKNVQALDESSDAATFKWAIEKGTQIARAQLNNRIGAALEYISKAPIPLETPFIARQFLEVVDWAVETAGHMAGVSRMASQSMKPAGLDSGAALREFADVQTQRFASLSKAYAQLHVDCAEAFLKAARQASADGDFSVSAPGKRFLSTVKWSDIADVDPYVCQPWPTSLLPKTPAAKVQFTQELVRAQLFTPSEGRQLMRFPDTEAVLSRETAAEDYAAWVLCKLLDDGEMVQPDPLAAPDLVAERVSQAYMRACTEMDEDDPRLALLRNFLSIIKRLLEPPKPDPTAAEAAGPPGGLPLSPPSAEPIGGAPPTLARPMPLPTSDLLPQGAPR